MEGQITIITGSKEAENKMMDTLERLMEAGVTIESKILSSDCTASGLRTYIYEDIGDVFMVGSSRAHTLCSYIAENTHRPIVGVPLDVTDDGLDLFNQKEPPKGAGFTTVGINDTKNAVYLALRFLELRKAHEIMAAAANS